MDMCECWIASLGCVCLVHSVHVKLQCLGIGIDESCNLFSSLYKSGYSMHKTPSAEIQSGWSHYSHYTELTDVLWCPHVPLASWSSWQVVATAIWRGQSSWNVWSLLSGFFSIPTSARATTVDIDIDRLSHELIDIVHLPIFNSSLLFHIGSHLPIFHQLPLSSIIFSAIYGWRNLAYLLPSISEIGLWGQHMYCNRVKWVNPPVSILVWSAQHPKDSKRRISSEP